MSNNNNLPVSRSVVTLPRSWKALLFSLVVLAIYNQKLHGAETQKAHPSASAKSSGTKAAPPSRLSKAQAAKTAGNQALAISLYKEVLMQDPGNGEVRLELVKTMIRAGLLDEGRLQLNHLQRSHPKWIQVYLTRGDLEHEAQNEISALKAFDHALKIDPRSQRAREGRLLTLSRLGTPSIALTEVKQFPGLETSLIQRLHEDEAALAIRRSENVYHENGAATIAATDQAVKLIEENLRRYPESERSLADYVRALVNRNRYREAIVVYESLITHKRAVPGYTHHSAGTAYSAEQRPEQAKEAFLLALRSDPNDFRANVGFFYALCDLNQFSQAKKHIDALAARPLDPEKKFEAEILSIWVRAYEDRLGVAQDRFSALLARVPASTSLHNALGRIYLWRGWPRRARSEFSYVIQRQPQDMEALTGLMDVDMALGDYQSARRRLTQLNGLTADPENLKKQKRALEFHGRPEVTMAIGTSQNKERAATGQGLRTDIRAYSPRLGAQHRLFAHHYYESSTFDAGSAYYKRLGLGWESIIARAGKVDLEIQQDLVKEKQTSVILGGEAYLSDFWLIKGRYDSNSIDVPLRARLNGIDGTSKYLGIKYRVNERAALEAGTQQLVLSDDNDRRSLWITGDYQFVQGPAYKANIALDVYTSKNTLINTAYFNPARDQTIQATLRNEWVGYRRYARSFYQRIFLSAGGYTQQDYATETIGSVRYEHEWNINDALNTRYSLAYVRRVYDGEPSVGPEAALSVNWKF